MQVPQEGHRGGLPLEQLAGRVDVIRASTARFTAGMLRTAQGRSASFFGPVVLNRGDQVVLLGRWEEHSSWGRQFKVQSFTYEQDFSVEGLAGYLANHPRFKGLGPARAEAIAARFGRDFGRVITEEPEWLLEVVSLPRETLSAMQEEWKKNRLLNATMTWLAGHGLTHHQITCVVSELGNDARALLERDPFLLMGRVPGFGFKKVDVIATRLGIAKDHPSRIRAGLLHLVEESLQNGDCWTDHRDLVEEALKVLKMDRLDSATVVERQLSALIEEDGLDCYSASCRMVVGKPALRQMEQDLWQALHEEQRPNPHFRGLSRARLEAMAPAELNEAQRRAFVGALSSNLLLLSGGAGSGKSHTLNAIAQACYARGLKVALSAPTGKAAKRLEQLTGQSALTLHRLLEYNGQAWKRDHDNPVEADVVIVDEVSMVDVPLAWRLFDALDLSRTALVLAGDHNQLPPVGPGNLLRDLIDRQPLPTVVLDQVVRQAGILRENSLAILKGEVRPSVPKDASGQTPWVLASRFTDADEARNYIVGLYRSTLVEKLKLSPLEDVQLLSPQYDGPLGVSALNVALQKLFQEEIWGRKVEPLKGWQKPAFYLHDKVIHTRNNYDLGVMNGSIGFITGVGTAQTEAEGGLGRSQLEVDYEGRRVRYDTTQHQDDELELAYALTVHKAQGSEFPCAIVVVHKDHAFMHHRNLFYTAVTRAQRMAIVVGDGWAIRRCAGREQVNRRRTFLSLLPTPRSAA